MPRGRCLRLIGNQSLASLALSSASYGVIDAAVARGALLHDLGKANDQFQRMVRGDETIQALSALGNRWDRKQSGLVVVGLSEVAGNQSRFLYDFSPESVIFRWTDDFAPRLLYGFRLDGEQPQLREEMRRRIESDDIDAKPRGRRFRIGLLPLSRNRQASTGSADSRWARARTSLTNCGRWAELITVRVGCLSAMSRATYRCPCGRTTSAPRGHDGNSTD